MRRKRCGATKETSQLQLFCLHHCNAISGEVHVRLWDQTIDWCMKLLLLIPAGLCLAIWTQIYILCIKSKVFCKDFAHIFSTQFAAMRKRITSTVQLSCPSPDLIWSRWSRLQEDGTIQRHEARMCLPTADQKPCWNIPEQKIDCKFSHKYFFSPVVVFVYLFLPHLYKTCRIQVLQPDTFFFSFLEAQGETIMAVALRRCMTLYTRLYRRAGTQKYFALRCICSDTVYHIHSP